MVTGVSQRLNHDLLNLREKLYHTMSIIRSSEEVCLYVQASFKTWSYLHDGLKHRDEDKFDESDLRSGFGDFVSVHEGGHRETLRLLSVTLKRMEVDVLIFVSFRLLDHGLKGKSECFECGHLHEVLLQKTVHPRLGYLGWPHFVGNITALDQDHLQLKTQMCTCKKRMCSTHKTPVQCYWNSRRSVFCMSVTIIIIIIM